MPEVNPYAAPAFPSVFPIDGSAIAPQAIRTIGIAQRRIYLALLGFLVLDMLVYGGADVLSGHDHEPSQKVFAEALALLGVLVSIAMRIVFAILCYQLARALTLPASSKWLWTIGGAIFILIAAAVLCGVATRRLRAAGVKVEVGFLGPKPEALQQVAPSP